jgi:hypothetical protein
MAQIEGNLVVRTVQRIRCRKVALGAIFISSFAICAEPALGTVFQLAGTIDTVTDPADLVDIQVGDPWAFEYEFDPDAEPTTLFPTKAIYTGWSGELSVGAMLFPFIDTSNAIYIYDDLYGGDRYSIGTWSSTWQSFRAISMNISLADLDGTALTGFGLPAVPPELSDFELTTFEVGAFDSTMTNHWKATGSIDSFTLVPEPSAAAIACLGVVALLCSKLRRR